MKKTTLVALTGGIGSGKTTALNIIKDLGFSVISCDLITHALYKKQWFLRKVKRLFPLAINGKIILKVDKSQISKQVFSDKEKHKKLSDLITPLILGKALKKARKKSGLVFIEVPLLFEKNLQSLFDFIVVILRDIESRINSVINRSKLTRDEVLSRIANQFDYDKLGDVSSSNVIKIYNDGDETRLKSQINSFINSLN